MMRLAGSKLWVLPFRELVRLVVGGTLSPINNCLHRHPREVTGKFQDNRASWVLARHQLISE